MRLAVVPLLAAASLNFGCLRNAPEIPPATASQLLSRIEAADPQAAPQMLAGFYPVEQRLWRWTAKTFSVSLATPRQVPDLPVELALRFTLPDVIVETLGPVTVTARVENVEIGSRLYERAGVGLSFDAPVPDSLLAGEKAVIAFELDKALIADEEPKRELGIVFLSAALR